MKEIPLEQDMDCLSMFRFMLFPMELTQNIIQTAQDGIILKIPKPKEQTRKKLATVLNLHHFGLMAITRLSLILSISRKHSSVSIRFLIF